MQVSFFLLENENTLSVNKDKEPTVQSQLMSWTSGRYLSSQTRANDGHDTDHHFQQV